MEREYEQLAEPEQQRPRTEEAAPAPAHGNAALARMSSANRALALAGHSGGNAALARSVRTLARDDTTTEAPPGRGVSTRFGEYWIVPDDTTQSYADITGEQITETEFAALQAVWDKLNDGTGSIQITEADDKGGDHAGFKEKILGYFGTMMSQPKGRALVAGLVNGSQTVTVGPTSSKQIANAARGAGSLENADGTAGVGGTTTIRMDADLTDTTIVVFDKDGNEIAAPVWSILAHELIHAEHNAAGRNKRNLAATDSAYSNREEEETIATGSGVTENALRAEHGMPDRHGHAGKVK